MSSMATMSTPINHMNTHSAVAHSTYQPVDAANRHEYGVQKSRKQTSTGGGRAWSEDEEVYLLQTRLQKMPYKHIAAHLKKTELACRLHYHQLSHGSNRRKQRTNSIASSEDASSTTQSPTMPHSVPSPVHEASIPQIASLPPYSYSPQSSHVQLPSASILLQRSASNSPPRTLNQPIAILPKPAAPRRTLSDCSAPLRLDTDVVATPVTVDKERLRSIYEAHRVSFWSVIASEYGGSVPALQLEEAWKQGNTHNGPPTPCVSPDTHSARSYPAYHAKPAQQLLTPVQENNKNNATSISALLGIDASPRSPRERELIKRMEESRDVMIANMEMA